MVEFVWLIERKKRQNELLRLISGVAVKAEVER